MTEGSDFLRSVLAETALPAPASTGKLKAFGWARVSTKMQEERGLSQPEQLRLVQEYADKNGFEIVEEFQEAGSAFSHQERRVEFKRMKDKAKADPAIKAILVYDYSRFSRDRLDGQVEKRELKRQGVRLISVTEQEFDTDTEGGNLMEAIVFAQSENYSKAVSKHTTKGCRANVRARDPETGWCYKNGGQPLWGYKSQTLERGTGRFNKPNRKAIWVIDDTIVAGKPTHEIVRHCLLELAAKGASLDELRDYCNNNSIPGRRNAYWSTSTWQSILQPNTLLQYCGFGVWGVHAKHGKNRPSDDWVIVPNAHEPLITEEQADQILEIRRNRKRYYGSQQRSLAKSAGSNFILTGGLFKCSRCGSNMVGKKSRGHEYYVCGSSKYRRGLGCGEGVYMPKQDLENDVVDGIQTLLSGLIDNPRLTRKVNLELRRLSESGTEGDLAVSHRLKTVDRKITNLVKSLEDGVDSTEIVKNRLRELAREKEELSRNVKPVSAPPQIDAEELRAYVKILQKAVAKGNPLEIKRIVGQCIEEMMLDPKECKVVIKKTTPEKPSPVLSHRLVAGAGFEPATFGL